MTSVTPCQPTAMVVETEAGSETAMETETEAETEPEKGAGT